MSAGALGKERKQINVYNHSREGTSVNGKMLVQDGVRPTVAKLGSVIKFGESSILHDMSCSYMWEYKPRAGL